MVHSFFCAALYHAMLSSDAFCYAELDRLLVLHDRYGLPHPPKDAVLVRFVSARDFGIEEAYGWVSAGVPALGFSRDGQTVLDHFGKPVPVRSLKAVKPEPAVLDGTQLGSLEDALQYHTRGWKELSLAAFRKWMAFWHFVLPEECLPNSAWAHWKQRIRGDADMPLATIARYLKVIHAGAEYPRGGERERMLASLELSLKPRNSLPGSDEALIDALIEMRAREPIDLYSMEGLRSTPQYLALVRRGFDAVPALIAHLGDDRLTRSYFQACGTTDLRVKDVVLDILMHIRGGPFAFDGWRGVLNDGVPKELLKEVGNWYAEAHKLGEEKYILAQILGEDKDDGILRHGMLHRLVAKYPQRLPDVLRKVIDERPNQHDYLWHYAKVVARAPIPEAERRKVLEYAATQKEPAARAAGAYYLSRLDPKRKAQLLRELAEMPNQNGVHAELARVVAGGTDPDEWKALALIVRQSDVASRVRLLDTVSQVDSPEGRKHRLTFLAEYLTDDAVYIEDRPGSSIRGEVRNLAATTLAELLLLDADPDQNRTAAQWAELRARVRVKLKEELGR